MSQNTLPVSVPTVLIPNVPDLTKWAVIACDQFTGEPEYWEQLTELVGEAPSAINVVLPEVWLEEKLASAPAEIQTNMQTGLDQGWFTEHTGFVLVERILPSAVLRLGLMVNIDLNAYEYTDTSEALIRATERTVPERLPARVSVRENAPLETPHALVLIDDPNGSVIEDLYSRRDSFEKLYDFDLNMGGGHVRGWLVPIAEPVLTKLNALTKDGLFAVVGDGNHSIAAAKLSGDSKALVELTNIHGPATDFEPIHRIVLGAGPELLPELNAYLQSRPTAGTTPTKVYSEGQTSTILVPDNPADAIADVQQFLDDYSQLHPEIVLDYIHGDENLVNIANREAAAGRKAVAIFLPTIDKAGLFEYSARRGVLPRKSFSIGHAPDKRYYLELAKRS